MQKQIWLLSVTSMIIVILIGILVFAPVKKITPPLESPPVTNIQISSPNLNEEVSSPIKITGIVAGNGWGGFEGQVGTVKLFDHNGLQLGKTAILTATTDWMQSMVYFGTNLEYTSNGAKDATLIFYNENPSGDPAKDKTFILPVKLK